MRGTAPPLERLHRALPAIVARLPRLLVVVLTRREVLTHQRDLHKVRKHQQGEVGGQHGERHSQLTLDRVLHRLHAELHDRLLRRLGEVPPDGHDRFGQRHGEGGRGRGGEEEDAYVCSLLVLFAV